MFNYEEISKDYLFKAKKVRLLEAVMSFIVLFVTIGCLKHVVYHLNSLSNHNMSLIMWGIISICVFLGLYYSILYLLPYLSVKMTSLEMDRDFGLIKCKDYWVTDVWKLESATSKQNNKNYFLNLNSHYFRIDKELYESLIEGSNKKSLLIIERERYEDLKKNELK